MSQIPRFFVNQLPAALYRIRWLSLAVTLATVVIALVYGCWAASNPAVLSTLGTESDFQRYREEFVNYYSNYGEASFGAQVWTNNAWIAAQCIAAGIVGFWAPAVLFQNAQSIGLNAAVLHHVGDLDIFFLYIAPHGQLELYSVFVAGAAGMAIFWSWIAPGARTRAQSLAEQARATFAIVIGLVLSLLLSGFIEGFVTRQDWPWPIKIGIGTVALAIFLVYQWVVGRRAAQAGETGDLEEFERGASKLIAG